MITLDDLFYGEDIAECDSCSLVIRVLFESKDLPDVEFETDPEDSDSLQVEQKQAAIDNGTDLADVKFETEPLPNGDSNSHQHKQKHATMNDTTNHADAKFEAEPLTNGDSNSLQVFVAIGVGLLSV